MQRWASRVERLLARTGLELSELIGDDLIGEEVSGLLLGDTAPEELVELLREERLRIRPTLISLSARAAGAASVDAELQHTAELLHVALLMHDLALGQPGGRRRRLVRRVVKRVGRSHVTVRALEIARHARSPDALSEVVDTLRAFSDGEQLAQKLAQSGAVPTVHDAEEHAELHHGALLAFCCRAGALGASAEVGAVAALGRYGRHMGRMWTYLDDLGHLAGSDAVEHAMARASSGRPVHVVAAAAASDPELAERWRALTLSPDPQTALWVVRRLSSGGAAGATREAVAKGSWMARQALRALPESRYRKALDVLAAAMAW
ncbi:MAG: hypothetical protein EA397_03460 [Deltaproteobacteria bacterium]|nr:MAG: hypothetical protein EA397_03460 [Deltaproteobacteria bacterium]